MIQKKKSGCIPWTSQEESLSSLQVSQMAVCPSLYVYIGFPMLGNHCWKHLCCNRRFVLKYTKSNLPIYRTNNILELTKKIINRTVPFFQEHVVIKSIFNGWSIAETSSKDSFHGLAQYMSTGMPIYLVQKTKLLIYAKIIWWYKYLFVDIFLISICIAH